MRWNGDQSDHLMAMADAFRPRRHARSSTRQRHVLSPSVSSDHSSDQDEDYSEEEDEEGEQDNRQQTVRKRRRIHFSVQELQKYYHLPLKTAASQLGICEAALKRICRRNHIRKWPYRKLASVMRQISDLQEPKGQPNNPFGTMNDKENQAHAAFLLPHEMERARTTVVMDKIASTTKLRRLEQEKTRIINSAHVRRTKPHKPLAKSKPTKVDQEPLAHNFDAPPELSFTQLLLQDVSHMDSLSVLAEICASEESKLSHPAHYASSSYYHHPSHKHVVMSE